MQSMSTPINWAVIDFDFCRNEIATRSTIQVLLPQTSLNRLQLKGVPPRWHSHLHP
jgi:hypothetical protein